MAGPRSYVRILRSLRIPRQRCVGYSTDPRKRLVEHNQGKCPHTSWYRSWRVSTYPGFDEETKARAFERYLKIGSGHAFAKRYS